MHQFNHATLAEQLKSFLNLGDVILAILAENGSWIIKIHLYVAIAESQTEDAMRQADIDAYRSIHDSFSASKSFLSESIKQSAYKDIGRRLIPGDSNQLTAKVASAVTAMNHAVRKYMLLHWKAPPIQDGNHNKEPLEDGDHSSPQLARRVRLFPRRAQL
jgi:hypothetical protein